MWKTRYTYTSNEEEVNMAHRSEQGNVLGFVLVGALLVALLLGGIFVVRHTIANQGDTGANVASNEAEDPDSASDNTSETDKSSSESTDKGASSSNQSLKDALDAQNSQNRGNSGTSANQASGSHDADTLPETGPADTAFAIVGATLLVGTGAAYAGSRRLI